MMKKIVFILLLLVMACATWAQGVEFDTTSFETALAKAKAENKYLFVDVYTTWCGPCRHVSQNVFPKPELGEYYNTHFVCYKLNAETPEGEFFTKKYPVSGYPTFYYLDGDGGVIHTFMGAGSVETFLQEGKLVSMYAKYGGKEAMYQSIENGTANLEMLYDYYQSATEDKKPEAVNLYLKALPDDKLMANDNKLVEEMSLYDRDLLERFIRLIVEVSHDGRYDDGKCDADFIYYVVFPVEIFISHCLEQSIEENNWEWFCELQELKKNFADFAGQRYPCGVLLDGDLNIMRGRGIFWATPDYQKLCFWTANRCESQSFQRLMVSYMDSLMHAQPVDSVLDDITYVSSKEALIGKIVKNLDYEWEAYMLAHHIATSNIIKWTDYFWRISPSDKKVKGLCKKWLQYAYDVNPANPYYVLSATNLLCRLDMYKEAEAMILQTQVCLKEVHFDSADVLRQLEFKLQDVRNQKL